MVFEHDYQRFPELTNRQLQDYGYTSPHIQITEDFPASVVRVHDGDTVTLRVDFRDFDFPLRLLGIDAPELGQGGEEARDYLKERVEDHDIMVKIDKNNRVGKYGRLLGRIIWNGIDMNQELLWNNLVKPFDQRFEAQLPDLNRDMRPDKWF